MLIGAWSFVFSFPLLLGFFWGGFVVMMGFFVFSFFIRGGDARRVVRHAGAGAEVKWE
ncbi:MAG: hypothetical protein FD143_2924 [Ignavibacteria bacterium]|nr:MAG: hypothetical protein FD143_2924 [Ignavibacteria bacterium]